MWLNTQGAKAWGAEVCPPFKNRSNSFARRDHDRTESPVIMCEVITDKY